MKKINTVFAIASLLLISCDRWSGGDFHWQNKSSHSVVMTLNGYQGEHTISLAPNQDTTFHGVTGSMNPQTIEEHFDGCRLNWFANSFTIEYDDGKVLKYTYPDDTVTDFSIYNIHTNNLVYELFDKGWQSRFVYTLTDEQYDYVFGK